MAEPETSTPARTDRSPWNWLLLIPIVVPLMTPLYNFDSPRLWGFPAFYWIQFLFILLGVVTTSIVYQMTKKRSSVSGSAGATPRTTTADDRRAAEGAAGDE
jgi:Protein of unknown function (DUF3311)